MKIPLFLLVTALLTVVSTLDSRLSAAMPMGTAFTYQGKLNDGTGPASGTYDFHFGVYETAKRWSADRSGRYQQPRGRQHDLFTVILDFGASVFTGDARWLEVSVRTNGGDAFTTLSPRQLLTPVPQALYAGNAQLLNGQPGTEFAPASSLSAYVAKAGDTMTGL